MLDNIKFTYEDECSSLIKKKNIDVNDLSVNSLPRALNVSLERKYFKIKKFLERHSDSDLSFYISQLYGFARSTNGLIKDKFRERIWPILAKNIPKAEKIKLENEENSQQSLCSSLTGVSYNLNDNIEVNSDSDFESAVSTFSTSTSSNSNRKFPRKKKIYDEISDSDQDIDEVRFSIDFFGTPSINFKKTLNHISLYCCTYKLSI